ncbi:MAG: YjjW family glycine radical enzyme activase [SAR324 cluster bacterium]|nr:YjjW family glycine radical enzyme activase [SAR324 cluster bacterium]MBL7034182.1 YjjW family glycine radical enzyme activase [SAR324 cluster bacterium]
MSKPLGLVNRILPFSAVDGPGNRFVIFLQGCNFNCVNCHNPQTIGVCDVCGICVEECPGEALQIKASGTEIEWNKSRCLRCDNCIKVCPSDSNPHSQWLDVDFVLEKIRRSASFLSGVTVSGGEATQQPEFLRELFHSIKTDSALNHLSTMIDTNGSAEISIWKSLLPFTDGAMVDLKAFDNQIHQKLTGNSNSQVLQSIQHLQKAERLFEVRLLIIPDLNDHDLMLQQTANWLCQLSNNIRIKLIGFRNHGVRPEYSDFLEATPERLDEIRELFQGFGIQEIKVI